MNTYTITYTPNGDYEIVTADHGRYVAYTIADALAVIVSLGLTLHPEHCSVADALGVAR
jgi:hypothetical protein